MDISKLQLVAGMVLVALASNIALAQENAVGGQVRLRGSEKPLGHVRIKVAQKPDVHDTTNDKDGVYVLLIPKSLKKFDLIYEHDNCFKVADEGILNEQAQNKRPVRELRSNSTASVRTLKSEEINEIVQQSLGMVLDGLRNEAPALLEAGQANLRALSAAAEMIGEQARAESNKGDVVKAEASYKISLGILEKASPLSDEFAGMLDQYASLLRKTGRSTLADQQAARAVQVRLQAKSFERTRPSDAMASFAFKSYSRGSLFEEWERYDSLALKHINSLPNLVGTITLLSSTEGQFGRVQVPAHGTASFRVHLEERRVPFIRILTERTVPFDLEVTGDKGRVELMRLANLITWNPTNIGKTFTVTISNKSAQKEDYVVHLSTRSSTEKAKP
jgi:tetratricopeptide (TPR) repeat protein